MSSQQPNDVRRVGDRKRTRHIPFFFLVPLAGLRLSDLGILVVVDCCVACSSCCLVLRCCEQEGGWRSGGQRERGGSGR